MTTTLRHWKERAIAQAETVTDAWEVTKVWTGRAAEWVLFGCMIVNIIEILPSVMLPQAVSNAILAVQAVTLDIAGFGLATMADHARAHGDEQAANRAQWTGYALIAIMLVTLLLVSVGLLWPVLKTYTDMGAKGLILIRVLMTVIYGHVIHGLRRVAIAPAPAVPAPDVLAALTQLEQRLQRQIHSIEASQSETRTALATLSGLTGDVQQLRQLMNERQQSAAPASNSLTPAATHPAQPLRPRQSTVKRQRITRQLAAVGATEQPQGGDIKARVRELLAENATLSSRKIAETIGTISHTTAAAIKRDIQREGA